MNARFRISRNWGVHCLRSLSIRPSKSSDHLRGAFPSMVWKGSVPAWVVLHSVLRGLINARTPGRRVLTRPHKHRAKTKTLHQARTSSLQSSGTPGELGGSFSSGNQHRFARPNGLPNRDESEPSAKQAIRQSRKVFLWTVGDGGIGI